MSMKPASSSLIALAGIGDRRQAFAELSLLTFSITLLIRLPRLLLRTWSGRCTAGKRNNGRSRHKQGNCQLCHANDRIIRPTTGGNFQSSKQLIHDRNTSREQSLRLLLGFERLALTPFVCRQLPLESF